MSINQTNFMKKIIITLVLFFSTIALFAQKDTVRLREIQKTTKSIVTDRAPQAIYFQIGGSGPAFSVNYDRRFGKRVNGAGIAAGIGYYGSSGSSIVSFPVSLNYLFGKSNNFIELAGGATFLTAHDTYFGSSNNNYLFYHLNLGYRYQPTKGGFFFRGGISPIFLDGEYVTSLYIGFGHNF